MNKEFIKGISKIQSELKAPKGQINKFGNYKYRSCEDILEAVKPLLGDFAITVNDEVVLIGDRFYIKATATITDGENKISNSAFARESLTKKGMDDAQVTGSASSYARKYALNGLLCIDDTKDSDATNEHGKNENTQYKKQYELIEEIKSTLTVTCKDMSQQEKAKIMKEVLKVSSFNELKGKNNEELKAIAERIGAITYTVEKV